MSPSPAVGSTQEQINRAYEPARFEVEERYPLALNTLFVTMFYSGGLPLLLPFAAFSFFMTFWIDKLSRTSIGLHCPRMSLRTRLSSGCCVDMLTLSSSRCSAFKGLHYTCSHGPAC